MVFKLVRTDAEEPNKIVLPVGTHLIGRGKFLDCEDKRISRNHGNLIVSEDSVAIEALHQNPCFWTKRGTEEIQILKKSCQETLQNGDKFGLLPGSYWYEVLHCTVATDSQATDVSDTTEKKSSQANDQENKPNNDLEKETQNETINNRDASNVGTNLDVSGNENDDSKLLDFDFNETIDDGGRSESPSLLDQQNQQQPVSTNKVTNKPEPSLVPTQEPNQTNEQATTDSATREPNQTDEQATTDSATMEPKSPSPKRSHSPDIDEGVKKIKTEPVDVKQEVIVKQEPEDAMAGPSNDQAGASNNADDVQKAPTSPAQPTNRERCMYAESCYRKNPQHKAQFSHPGDADWGAGAQAPCPFGAACRKRDPRHWRLHSHPPAARPPPPVPRTKANKYWRRRSSEESEASSDGQTSEVLRRNHLILNGKRARKPLPKASVDSDSEPEDPFQSDGSDEWEPPTDNTESLDF